IYKIDLDHANKVLSMQEDETGPAEVQEVVDVVTTAKIITEVVTATCETINAASTNITVEELKRHLQIVPNEDDDVYTEATPLARKVPVVDYQIIELNNKPYYKIIRADDTQQLYGMLVEQQVVEEGDDYGNDETVNAGDAIKGDRVKKLERRNKVRVLKLRRLQKVGTSQRVKTSDETMMDDESNHGRIIAKMDQDADVVLEDDKEVIDDVKDVHVKKSAQDQGRIAESQAEIYKIDLDHANKVLSMQEDETGPAEVQEVVDVVTTAKIITEVVTAACETITTASTNITVAKAQG
nr:hypothetical protein [Tanacetum cinerariifolium]